MSTPFAPEPVPERDNGLVADAYRRLRTVERRECDTLLEAMARAEVACYTALPENGDYAKREIFVDAGKQALASAIADATHARFASRRVHLDADEVDSRFAELVGSLDATPPAPPTDAPTPSEPPAGRPTGAGPDETAHPWRGTGSDWLDVHDADDDEHYEPPPPSPLPQPSRKVIAGILLMIAGAVAVFAPSSIPIPGTAALVAGVLLLGAGTVVLVLQLRDQPDDPFDDGARV